MRIALLVVCALGSTTLPPERILGMSVAHLHAPLLGYGSARSHAELKKLKLLGVTWVSVMPFIYMSRTDSPTMSYGGDPSLQDGDWQAEVKHAHETGLRVMLKPHIWSHAGWTGDIAMKSPADWERFFDAYTAIIEAMAEKAQAVDVDMLCVGVELKQATRLKPELFRALIAKVRAKYAGPLTYAANWDEVLGVAFWDALDVMGVDAYFPAAKSSADSAEQMALTLRASLEPVDALATKLNRPWVMTEVGYPALKGGSVRPWELPGSGVVDEKEAARAYTALMTVMPTFKAWRGMFAWKWYTAGNTFLDRDAYALEGTESMAVLTGHYRRWSGR